MTTIRRRLPIVSKWITECADHATPNSAPSISFADHDRTCHHCSKIISPGEQFYVNLLPVSWTEMKEKHKRITRKTATKIKRKAVTEKEIQVQANPFARILTLEPSNPTLRIRQHKS